MHLFSPFDLLELLLLVNLPYLLGFVYVLCQFHPFVVAFDPQSSEISIINRPEIQSTGQTEVGQIALFVGGVEVGTVDSTNSGWQFSAGQVPQARTFSEREVSSIGDKVESVVNQITGQRAPSRTNDSDSDENNSEEQASTEESSSEDESQDGESEEEDAEEEEEEEEDEEEEEEEN